MTTGRTEGDALPVISTQRFSQNPLVTPSSMEQSGYSVTEAENINGPSVIRAPAWLPNRRGDYYLYFAHHSGDAIRLAYSDSLEGPWKMHTTGSPILGLGQGIAVAGGEASIFHHIASPDVHVDESNRAIVMYFHGPVATANGEQLPEQKTFVATSRNGLDFVVEPHTPILGESYFRVFDWRGRTYAISNRGWLWRAPEEFNPLEPGLETSISDAWERGPSPLLEYVQGSEPALLPRHSTVRVVEDSLDVFVTYIGHDPERILHTRIALLPDWEEWRVVGLTEVLRPELDYEGAELASSPSVGGAQTNVSQLRDPYLFVDADSQSYLFYSVKGELGIAGATIELSG